MGQQTSRPNSQSPSQVSSIRSASSTKTERTTASRHQPTNQPRSYNQDLELEGQGNDILSFATSHLQSQTQRARRRRSSASTLTAQQQSSRSRRQKRDTAAAAAVDTFEQVNSLSGLLPRSLRSLIGSRRRDRSSSNRDERSDDTYSSTQSSSINETVTIPEEQSSTQLEATEDHGYISSDPSEYNEDTSYIYEPVHPSLRSRVATSAHSSSPSSSSLESLQVNSAAMDNATSPILSEPTTQTTRNGLLQNLASFASDLLHQHQLRNTMTSASSNILNSSRAGANEADDDDENEQDLDGDIRYPQMTLIHQVEMLSRLLDLAVVSTVHSLLTVSGSRSGTFNGRRFDNNEETNRNSAGNDTTFEEFVDGLRTGDLLIEELLRSRTGNEYEEGEQEEMSFFRAFRFDNNNGNETQPQTTGEPAQVPVLIIGVRSVLGNPDNSDSESMETPSEDSSNNARSWVIFIIGNSFSSQHPILTLPTLFADFDSSPTYEQLLRLQELLGDVKSVNVVSKDELKKHEDEIYQAHVVNDEDTTTSATLPCGGLTVSQSNQCQICLSGYQSSERIRKLTSCGHFFHKDCIDEWLVQGKNSCPLCRAKGIQTMEENEGKDSVSDVFEQNERLSLGHV
ncbi:hypothetical protein WICPIJ_000497 [Wickerhamomyces pijperi]|uniref:RING-type domain-containing protein n=1 Tax=Wickerhamomyces pijperi TaxID=599730 RepID=A0A9P8QDD9_WICPI|nr:hypothetical protein WICPIJ_000497 [Wickerhamomyces pijperi]